MKELRSTFMLFTLACIMQIYKANNFMDTIRKSMFIPRHFLQIIDPVITNNNGQSQGMTQLQKEESNVRVGDTATGQNNWDFQYKFDYTQNNYPQSTLTFNLGLYGPSQKIVWIDNNSLIQYLEYDQQAVDNKSTFSSADTVPNGIDFFLKSADVSCLLVLSISNLFMGIYDINAKEKTITLVENIWSTVTQIAPTNMTPTNTKISSNCQRIFIQKYIYIRNDSPDSPKYTKNQNLQLTQSFSSFSSLVYTPVLSFDQSLNYYMTKQRVYKINANDTEEILMFNNSVALYDASGDAGNVSTVSFCSLLLNKDQTRLYILQFQTSFLQTMNASYYTTVYVKKDGNWSELLTQSILYTNYTPQELLSVSYNVIVVISQDLLTFHILHHHNETDGTIKFYNRLVRINQTDYSTKQFLYPNEIESKLQAPLLASSMIVFKASQNYLFVRYNQVQTEFQLIYKLDMSSSQLVQVHRTQTIADSQGSLFTFKFYKIVQQDNQLIVYKGEAQMQSNNLTLYEVQRIKKYTYTNLEPNPEPNPAPNPDTINGNIVIIDNMIYECPPACLKCSQRTKCTNCILGYVIDNTTNLCFSCINCATCKSSQQRRNCLSCFDGNYLQDGLCYRCHQSCLTCDDKGENHCTNCILGYVLDSNNTCKKCIENCDRCNSTDDCLDCRFGYSYDPVAKSCVRCAISCTRCNQQKIWQCSNCTIGYQAINVDGQLKCQICPENCYSCQNSNCKQCRQGYILSMSQNCINKCFTPCETCDQNIPTLCKSCIGGYTLNNATCEPDISCNQNSSCTACPMEYSLIENKCQKCQGANCLACVQNSTDTCLLCNRGYYLTQENKCQTCIQGCQVCSDNNTCQICRDGYVSQGYSYFADKNYSSKCIKCHESCASCYFSPYFCQKCAQGYQRQGWLCESKTKVQYQIKLDIPITQIKTSHLQALQTKLSENSGVPLNDISISSVESGSTVVSGSVSAANSSNTTEIAQKLKSSLGKGASIAGINIIDSSFVTNTNLNPLPQDNLEYSNLQKILLIVLVIVVPFVVIGILFLVAYKFDLCCFNQSKMHGKRYEGNQATRHAINQPSRYQAGEGNKMGNMYRQDVRH